MSEALEEGAMTRGVESDELGRSARPPGSGVLATLEVDIEDSYLPGLDKFPLPA